MSAENIEKIMEKIRGYALETYGVTSPRDQNEEEFEPKVNMNAMLINQYLNPDKPILPYRKYIGRYVMLTKKFIRKILRWHINPLTQQQTAFNGAVVKAFSEVNDVFRDVTQKISILENRVNTVDNKVNTVEDKVNTIENKVNTIENKINSIEIKIDATDTFVHDMQKTVGQISSEIVGIRKLFEDNNLTRIRLDRLERRYNQAASQGSNIDVSAGSFKKDESILENHSFDYFLFEEKFRGPREEIKERQSAYLQYYLGKEHVLDIGCGRGEFVELLIENGVPTTGIDINEDMVLYCREKGLPVKEIDVIEYLNSLPGDSLGGIFLGQVIEHLSINELVELIKLSYEKLQQGAYIIAETPNPQSMIIFTNTFYMDPSHNKPVHPLTIQFLLETNGFSEVNFKFSAPVSDEEWKLPHIKGGSCIDNIEQFNKAITRLNDVLFGYQDYAVIAKK